MTKEKKAENEEESVTIFLTIPLNMSIWVYGAMPCNDFMIMLHANYIGCKVPCLATEQCMFGHVNGGLSRNLN
ncbi:hypothetical protein STEG23_025996, partial [Scotinomys teguina]